jgi:GumC protein
MDETIDLRPYVEALLRRWWVILGAVVAGIIIAALLYFSQSGYKATALVAVTDPTQRLQFDPRIVNTLDLDTLVQAYPELATSDGVMAILLERASELTGGRVDSMPLLREMLEVETGNDPRLVRLNVHNGDPQLTADLANAWATTFVAVVDSIYLNPGGEVDFFSDQLAQTKAQLQTTEQALVEFQSGSRMGIVDNELASLTSLQASYLDEQNRLNLVLDDIRALRSQIESGEGETIPFSDQLTALLLQMRIYETESQLPSSETTVPETPIQLQLDSQGSLTTGQRVEQLRLLDAMAQAAQNSLDEIDVKLLGLEPQMFELQREKQDLLHRYEELTRSRDVASETYLTLARKIDEVRIQTEDSGSGLKIASLASPPAEPDRGSPLILALMGATVGFLLSVGLIIAITWWRTTGRRSIS